MSAEQNNHLPPAAQAKPEGMCDNNRGIILSELAVLFMLIA